MRKIIIAAAITAMTVSALPAKAGWWNANQGGSATGNAGGPPGGWGSATGQQGMSPYFYQNQPGFGYYRRYPFAGTLPFYGPPIPVNGSYFSWRSGNNNIN